jgi:hypothetical protein
MSTTWRKSTYSSDVANCVEVGYWRNSTDQANCLEFTFTGPAAGIRDSKTPNAPPLTLAHQAFLTFTTR